MPPELWKSSKGPAALGLGRTLPPSVTTAIPPKNNRATTNWSAGSDTPRFVRSGVLGTIAPLNELQQLRTVNNSRQQSVNNQISNSEYSYLIHLIRFGVFFKNIVKSRTVPKNPKGDHLDTKCAYRYKKHQKGDPLVTFENFREVSQPKIL